ncbi:hypothetical protein IFM89_035944 [Coptis chinensis]|uniref:PI4-kinase N-terminal domain-containing protein n=1 Tax=Coptis chinensis TaxID=261450 RepID=A0A835GZU1_9MAGN|nr:hypothetical protein IFM89_035944 [Coptis chinensis]
MLFQDKKEKQTIPVVQLSIIRLLADLNVSINKSEMVDMVLPLFIESLEEGDASAPSLLRLQVCAEATTERVETLPLGFLLIASGLSSSKLRLDYRHRLLSLCLDLGLAAESKSGRSGANFLGPLLPAIAEICSDFDPTAVVAPSLLKLFRNLWFYVALFGLALPIQKVVLLTKFSTILNSAGSMSGTTFQVVVGPYMWNTPWSVAIQLIAQGTPPLVVSSVKWLEYELLSCQPLANGILGMTTGRLV